MRNPDDFTFFHIQHCHLSGPVSSLLLISIAPGVVIFRLVSRRLSHILSGPDLDEFVTGVCAMLAICFKMLF